jgi:hypothetical protein
MLGMRDYRAIRRNTVTATNFFAICAAFQFHGFKMTTEKEERFWPITVQNRNLFGSGAMKGSITMAPMSVKGVTMPEMEAAGAWC